MEEETVVGHHNTKVSDSGYSNSCSNNSQSQRSGSSKSRHSGSSSGSSGYCGHPSTLGSSNDSFQHPSATKQRKEYKKKKLKAMAGDILNDTGGTSTTTTPTAAGALETIPAAVTSPLVQNIESAFLPTSSAHAQSLEKENIQLNPLSHPSLSINCIKKLRGKDINAVEEICQNVPSPARSDVKDIDDKIAIDNVNPTKTEFSAVVSMQEGVVLYTTSSLTDVLGYPKDMWLGRSLIDFVHPKDRKAFNSHITSGIATPLAEQLNQGAENPSSSKRNSFYCCLRQYRGLKSTGFGIIEKKVSYLPCQLTLAFREISTKSPVLDEKNDTSTENQEVASDGNVLRAILLVITARLIRSSYTTPDEICASSTYTTRHSTSMVLTHVDSEVVTYFGFLPQDMIGRSVFDFYHPEDLPYLKEVYESVFKDKGQPFRSKPYRFRTQNGGFALVETEWSSFVNPWTKKVEFVTGQHRVIKGPPNPNVTTPCAELEPLQISEEVLKESKAIQEEIRNILNETAETPDSTKCQMTKYCKELLKFIENIVDEDKTPSDKSESKPVSLSISDRDSVMLGEISPHHEYYDSKSSTETPPSYNQLNYNDNIQRFFESKPKTTLSDESRGGSKMSLCRERNAQLSGGDEEGKISPVVDSSCGSQNSGLNNESGGSSDLSSGGTSGNSAANVNNANDPSSINKYRTPHLTEELLSRHNENMEKKMVQMHRERSKSDREHKLKDGRHKKSYDKILDEQNAHGVKRSGSHSWEGEPYKSIKQTHAANEQTTSTSINNTQPGTKIADLPATASVYPKNLVNSSSNVNLWPPFSVTVTPLHSAQPCGTHMSYSAAPLTNTMMPVYYMTTPDVTSSARVATNTTNPNINSSCTADPIGPPLSPYIQPSQAPYVTGQFQYLTSMMYHPLAAMPMYGVPPVMYSPLTMLPAPLLPTQPMKPQTQQQQTQQQQQAQNQHQRPQMSQQHQQSSGSNNMASMQSQQNKNCLGKMTQRPASQATSVKAEPGSALCSVASNSLLQAMSETSKRDCKSVRTPSPHSIISQQLRDGCGPGKMNPETEDVNSNYNLETTINNDSSSYYSSFYSFMKSDEKSDESMKSLTENDSSADTQADNKPECLRRRRFGSVADNKKGGDDEGNENTATMHRQIRKVPPWLENVSLSPDLMFRYQVSEKALTDVLEADLKILTDIHQPLMVNDQLCQLYLDIENFHQQDCSLETSIGITSSSGTSSSEADDCSVALKTKKKYKSMEYHDRMVMLFEENAPMPPPMPFSHTSAAPSLLSVEST